MEGMENPLEIACNRGRQAPESARAYIQLDQVNLLPLFTCFGGNHRTRINIIRCDFPAMPF